MADCFYQMEPSASRLSADYFFTQARQRGIAQSDYRHLFTAALTPASSSATAPAYDQNFVGLDGDLRASIRHSASEVLCRPGVRVYSLSAFAAGSDFPPERRPHSRLQAI